MTMAWEFAVLDFIQSHLRCGFLDAVIPLITALGNGGALWIVLTLTMLIIPKTRKVGAMMAVGLIIEVLCCNVIIKPLVARIRPFDVNTAVQLLVARPEDFSFPSGHTGSSFAVVSAMFFAKHKLWIPGVIIAALIAFSRLYLYVHYPTDVIAGLIFGIVSGWLGCILVNYIIKKRAEKKAEK